MAVHAMRRATWWTQVVEIIKEGRQPRHRHFFANCALLCKLRAVLCHCPPSACQSRPHTELRLSSTSCSRWAHLLEEIPRRMTPTTLMALVLPGAKKAVGQNKAGGDGVRGGVRVPCLLQNSSDCSYFEKDKDLSGVAGWMLQGFCVRFRHPYQYICVACAYVMASATRNEQRQVIKANRKAPMSICAKKCTSYVRYFKASKISYMCIPKTAQFLDRNRSCALHLF